MDFRHKLKKQNNLFEFLQQKISFELQKIDIMSHIKVKQRMIPY